MRSTAQSLELLNLLENETAGRAADGLLDFAIYTRSHYDPNWHHRLLCEKLNQFSMGKIPRLMVFMPPRHGKSELVSRCLPAYLLGRDPNTSVIATSYSAALASRMNRDVQRLIDSDEYMRVFPNTRLNSKNVVSVAQGTWLRNSSTFEVVDQRGVYRSAGVGGGITGMGARFGIIDDPIKNQEDAYSIAYREKLWDWYTSTFYTRLEGEDAAILITLTRWHEDDLAGRLLQQAKDDPTADQWEVLSLPAVCEEDKPYDPREIGEALWPERFPLKLLEKNKAQGMYVWNSLFQQRPAAMSGNLVHRDWLRYYSELPKDVDGWLTSWDMSFKKTKKGSFVVGQIWARKEGCFYLVDQFRNRVGFPDTIEAMRRVCAKYPKAKEHLVESAANGPAVIDTLHDEIPGLIPIGTNGESKESRLVAVAPWLESGNVFFPVPAHQPWVDELVDELVTFPNAANDDQVDALSQALNRYRGDAAQPSDFRLDLDIGLRSAMESSYG